MAQIPPITDAYIDEIIKATDAYNPNLNKTQGVKLRELIKLMRDKFEQTALISSSGVYTPNFTDVSQTVTPVTSYLAHYTRVGNEVTVTGRLHIENGGGHITIKLSSPPISSNLTEFDDATGMASAVSPGYPSVQGNVYYNTSLNSVVIDFEDAQGIDDNAIRFSFTYTVK